MYFWCSLFHCSLGPPPLSIEIHPLLTTTTTILTSCQCQPIQIPVAFRHRSSVHQPNAPLHHRPLGMPAKRLHTRSRSALLYLTCPAGSDPVFDTLQRQAAQMERRQPADEAVSPPTDMGSNIEFSFLLGPTFFPLLSALSAVRGPHFLALCQHGPALGAPLSDGATHHPHCTVDHIA